MSGLYLLALIGLWLFVGKIIYRIWRGRKPQKTNRKILHVVIGLVLFSVWFGGAFWEVAGNKIYWDAQVRKLCAIDGGVKVYETMALPNEMFNRWGQPNFYGPAKDEDLLSNFLLKQETKFIRDETKRPEILRHHFRVYRRSDKKLLGEQISYSRRGGGMLGLWHISSFSCPNIKEKGLLGAVFSHPNKKKGE